MQIFDICKKISSANLNHTIICQFCLYIGYLANFFELFRRFYFDFTIEITDFSIIKQKMLYSSSQKAAKRLENLQNHLQSEGKEQKINLRGKMLYTAEDVAKHNTEDDCWVIINGEVVDATSFINDHPGIFALNNINLYWLAYLNHYIYTGGKSAIMMYAGKDATRHYNIVHMENVIAKYAPDTIIGTLI